MLPESSVFQAFPEDQVNVLDLFVVDNYFINGRIKRTLQRTSLCCWDDDNGLVFANNCVCLKLPLSRHGPNMNVQRGICRCRIMIDLMLS